MRPRDRLPEYADPGGGESRGAPCRVPKLGNGIVDANDDIVGMEEALLSCEIEGSSPPLTIVASGALSHLAPCCRSADIHAARIDTACARG